MSLSYSLSPEEVSWSRSRGNIEISASTERNVLSNPIGRAHNRGFKKGDDEEPTRKRIRVACSRCRKRKIKCSGPIGGEDQPCLNCRNAGANTYCAFELTGSIKVDLDNLRQSSRDYMYGMSNNTAGSLSYPNEYPGSSLGAIMLQYPAPSHPGSYRQRDLSHQPYTTTYGGGQDYYDYGQHLDAYEATPSYSTSEAMLQIALQGHTVLSTQEHIAPWNLEQHNVSNSYDRPIQPVSDSPSTTLATAPTLPSTQSSTALSTTTPAVTDRALPKPPQIPSPSPAVGNFLVSDVRERLYWHSNYDSQPEGESSRTPSQQTSSSRSSATQTSLFDQGIEAATDLSSYAILPSSTVDSNVPLTASTNVIQQNLSSSQHSASDKYQYHYSTLKPVPMPAAVPTAAIDTASMGSIGNHAFTHLPYRSSDKCGILQYQVRNRVRKVPSRIAMEVGSASAGRVVEKL